MAIDRDVRKAIAEQRINLKKEDLKKVQSGGLSHEQLDELATRYSTRLRTFDKLKEYNEHVDWLFGRTQAGIERGLSRLYDTAEGLTYRVVDGTFHIAGRALLPLALLGSMILGAEAYKPGTIQRIAKELPQIVQSVEDAVQQMYRGQGSSFIPPNQVIPPATPLPKYNTPSGKSNLKV